MLTGNSVFSSVKNTQVQLCFCNSIFIDWLLCFQTYTQYIPLSVYDLQTWMGAPSIYVYDCSNAGIIVDSFKQFADQHEKEYEVFLALHTNRFYVQSNQFCIALVVVGISNVVTHTRNVIPDVIESLCIKNCTVQFRR